MSVPFEHGPGRGRTAGLAGLLIVFLVANSSCRRNAEKERSKAQPEQPAAERTTPKRTGDIVLAIHGGAGTIRRSEMTPEAEAAYRAAMKASLEAGYEILSGGGSSLDAVEAAIVVLEDSPLFNAGKGAVYNHEGGHELDASIMVSDGRKAGAVAGVTRIKNPIRAARAVMEHSPHVLLAGPGADSFAKLRGLDMVDPSFFGSELRKQQLDRALEQERIELDHGGGEQGYWRPDEPDKYGTVGAVAIDKQGQLAAGTSTGGMTNKRHGRVGDSPIIGAGTYASDDVAVSCTGHGEFFIRYAVAHDLAARLRHGKLALDAAAQAVIRELEQVGGSGGLIAVDRHGNVAMPFNTGGMYRGTVNKAGTIVIDIY